jgi:hypothetical protein
VVPGTVPVPVVVSAGVRVGLAGKMSGAGCGMVPVTAFAGVETPGVGTREADVSGTAVEDVAAGLPEPADVTPPVGPTLPVAAVVVVAGEASATEVDPPTPVVDPTPADPPTVPVVGVVTGVIPVPVGLVPGAVPDVPGIGVFDTVLPFPVT